MLGQCGCDLQPAGLDPAMAFSIVSVCRRSDGGVHSAEGGIRPEGQGNLRFQRRLVVLDREEVVPTPVNDGAADLRLVEYGSR
jgi:hypothetical protein